MDKEMTFLNAYDMGLLCWRDYGVDEQRFEYLNSRVGTYRLIFAGTAWSWIYLSYSKLNKRYGTLAGILGVIAISSLASYIWKKIPIFDEYDNLL